MRRITITIILILTNLAISTAQYISETIEYKPAPGQYINTDPWGIPSAAESITGTIQGKMNLGAFGGYVIFKFAEPVENDPDNPYGVDFTIFGNPSEDWSEPGVVSVMKDENNNGQPDDTWYELAGSDYHFTTSIHNYKVTYTNPHEDEAADVPWTDNQGNSGYILSNAYHTQPYYPSNDSFPSIDPDEYSLNGTLIQPMIDTSTPGEIKSYKRAFGYADNQVRGSKPYTIPDNPYTRKIENSGGDPFDIHWAIDSAGNYVNLDTIHFVKVHNGMLDHAGWLGEISTEITGAVDVAPDASINGIKDMVVIQDLPVTIDTTAYPLHAFAFYKGRIQPDKEINWSVDTSLASIDESNILNVSDSCELTLTASLAENPSIADTITATFFISEEEAGSDTTNNDTTTAIQGKPMQKNTLQCTVYPNPADHFVKIEGIDNFRIQIFNSTGKKVYEKTNYTENKPINLNGLSRGVYLIKIEKNNQRIIKRFIKK